MITYGSVCSGIESASVAWHPLGWKPLWFAEIEKFPSQVLAHHYPDVPNWGDMTQLPELLDMGMIEASDVLVGGCPCQSFSVAGLRKGLSDHRGQLTLSYVLLADKIDELRIADGKEPCIIVYENVPGLLSSSHDNAFGCFIGALAGSDELHPPTDKRGKRLKWPDAGCVIGPERTVAWRIFDAQYFGLAQRRRRVFVVASAREDINPTEILFEFDGVQRDTPPSRETGQKTAGDAGSGVKIGSHWDGKDIAHPTLSQSLQSSGGTGMFNQELFSQRGAGLVQDWPAEVASTLDAHYGSKFGYEDHRINSGAALFVPAYGIPGNWIGRKPENGGNAVEPMADIAPCQTKTDRHGVCAAIHPHVIGRSPDAGPQGKEYLSDGSAYTMDSRGVAQCVAFEPGIAKCEGGESRFSVDVSSTLRKEMGDNQPAVAYPLDTQNCSPGHNSGGLGFGQDNDPSFTLTKGHSHAVDTQYQVRRLTPTECHRLQGFPDGYLDMRPNGKPTPDGVQYKALGNSMATPCMGWIGRRIQQALSDAEEALDENVNT